VNSPLPLPADLAEAHALILHQREELAAAEARASGAAAMIAHLKLVIAKLRRDQYGQSAERGRKLLDQLELQLEELEADATERSVIAERDTSVQAFTRRRPVRAPCRHICRASASSSRRPAPARSAAASWPNWARTSPRPWR
jgi:hypothetical protein